MLTNFYRALVILLLFGVTVVAGACQPSEDKNQAPTLDKNRQATLNALVPSTVPTEARTAPTDTPPPEVDNQLAILMAQITNAVLDGDRATYERLIWREDDLFWQEQQQWITDWIENPPSAFDLQLNQVRLVNPTLATARLTISWRFAEAATEGQRRPGTTLSVQFKRETVDEAWKFAGEYWETLGVYQQGSDWAVEPMGAVQSGVERFRIYYFPNYGATQGTNESALAIGGYLPSLYTAVTEGLDYIPLNPIPIKLYTTEAELGAFNAMSYNAELAQHVAPQQALKVSELPTPNDQLPPDASTVLYGLVYMMYFEMNPQGVDRDIWWVVEGMAQFINGKNLQTVIRVNNVIQTVATEFSLRGELPSWDALMNVEAIPWREREMASLQAHTMILYIEETYQSEKRQAWFKAIVEGQTPQSATETILEVDFETLNAGWLAWLQQPR